VELLSVRERLEADVLLQLIHNALRFACLDQLLLLASLLHSLRISCLFCAISVLKSQNTERLPRQARDKHTGKVDKETFLFRSENKMNELKEHASRARTADDDERSVHPYFEDIRKTARQERCAENAFP
jgi:hypothetical protein